MYNNINNKEIQLFCDILHCKMLSKYAKMIEEQRKIPKLNDDTIFNVKVNRVNSNEIDC